MRTRSLPSYTPREYATRLVRELDSAPSSVSRLTFRPGMTLIVALAPVFGEFAMVSLFVDGPEVIVTVADIVGMAYMLVLTLAAVVLGIRATTHTGRRARVAAGVASVAILLVMPVSAGAFGERLGSDARVLALSPWGCFGIAVLFLVVAAIMLMLTIRRGRPVDPR